MLTDSHAYRADVGSASSRKSILLVNSCLKLNDCVGLLSAILSPSILAI